MNIAYLSLGSNIEPEANLRAAIELLAAQTNLLAVSSAWETRPLGLTNQPNFLNAAAMVETSLTAAQLKYEILTPIEQQLGRVRSADRNAPRPIDLDIVLFNQDVFRLGRRRIPDPEIVERPFIAIPLAEIAPAYAHPELGQTLFEIAQNFEVTNNEMSLRPDVSEDLKQVKQNR